MKFHDAHNRPMRDAPLPSVPALFPRLLREKSLSSAEIPDEAGCGALWDKYAMPAHIRAHSIRVAGVAESLGRRLQAGGARIDLSLLLAGALLHDLAKAYTIEFGGNHAQLGAAWTRMETGSPRVAQLVFHHVHWPWPLDLGNESMLPCLLVLYADKRVRHDVLVSIEERFQDLMRRYGHTEKTRIFIRSSMEQGLEIERALSARLGVNLDEDTFDSRRLV
ncbi:MAG: HD domain-containing protein [Deltaproteobacteria bacterium]|nr:HD domain-containing protein [Deltaproteobacteria bacterium]